MVTEPEVTSQRAHEAQEAPEIAADASKNANSGLNQMLSSLPSVPKSRDELLAQIGTVETNLRKFYNGMVAEAEHAYPHQVESLRHISAEALRKVDDVRKNLTPALESAREHTASLKTLPGELTATAQARYPSLGTIQSAATNVLANVPGIGVAWAPAVDLLDTPEGYIVRVDLPGADRDDVSVTVRNKVVLIEGTIKQVVDSLALSKLAERKSGSFSRVVAVTEPVREESVVINLDKGVLEIFIPKAGAVAEGKKRVD